VRRRQPARPTPGSPEVRQNRNLAVANDLVELLFVDFDRFAYCRQVRLAGTTFANIGKMLGRNAIGSTARGAISNRGHGSILGHQLEAGCGEQPDDKGLAVSRSHACFSGFINRIDTTSSAVTSDCTKGIGSPSTGGNRPLTLLLRRRYSIHGRRCKTSGRLCVATNLIAGIEREARPGRGFAPVQARGPRHPWTLRTSSNSYAAC
jgi:hypothetical protein